MGIRIEQLDVQSVSKVFVTRVELDTRVVDLVKDYLKNEQRVVSVTSGEGIEVTGTPQDVTVTMKKATPEEIGGIRVGRNLNIDEQGVLSSENTRYNNGEGITIEDQEHGDKLISIKKATSGELGGIKVGSGLTLNDEGVASVNVTELPEATNLNKGLVKLGTGLVFNEETRSVDVQFKDDVAASDIAMSIAGNSLTFNPGTGKLDAKEYVAGNGLTHVEDGQEVTFNVKTATMEHLGLVKPGQFTSVQEDGSLDVNIPKASKANHGTIKLGNGLTYDDASQAVDVTINKATYNKVGLVKPSGKNITVDSDGTIEAVIGMSDIEKIMDNIKDINVKLANMQQEIENITTIIGQIDKDTIMKIYPTNFITGTNVFNGLDGLEIELPDVVTNDQYTVILNPAISTNGSLGEFWIENKTAKSFRVASSGRLVSVKFDWVLILKESATDAFNATKFPFQHGNATLNPSAEGVQVTLPKAMPDTDYSVYITPVENHLGEYGEVWVDNKTTNGFKIKTSGGTNSKVNYMVVRNTGIEYNAEKVPAITGTANFEGNRLVEIRLPEEKLTDRAYQVIVTPAADSQGHLGEYWVEDKSLSSFRVRTTGGTEVPFNYTVFGV